MRSLRFRLKTPRKGDGSVLPRYSPARRLEQTCKLLTVARGSRITHAVSAALSALHCACTPTVGLGMEVLPCWWAGPNCVYTAVGFPQYWTAGRLF